MGDSRSLQALYGYNVWADAQVFDVCRGVDAAQLEAAAAGTSGTITETLKHLVGVESVYLQMLRGASHNSEGTREEFWAHDLAWFADQAAKLGSGYQDLLASADDAFFDQALAVPWFDFTLTKLDGLLQVLAHSAQHRAQVLSVLGDRGVEVPDVDYVLYVRSAQLPAK